ncbi:MAG TPA: hypothetical protein DDW77_09890 [Verrucomicrobiales bacterium]|nr:hypothetical protein [Verrucomicrobiales bacterium]
MGSGAEVAGLGVQRHKSRGALLWFELIALIHGQTDPLGYHAVENVVHVRDLHATMLHLLGIDHQRLSVPFQGLDARLTGVEKAHPIGAIMRG